MYSNFKEIGWRSKCSKTFLKVSCQPLRSLQISQLVAIKPGDSMLILLLAQTTDRSLSSLHRWRWAPSFGSSCTDWVISLELASWGIDSFVLYMLFSNCCGHFCKGYSWLSRNCLEVWKSEIIHNLGTLQTGKFSFNPLLSSTVLYSTCFI